MLVKKNHKVWNEKECYETTIIKIISLSRETGEVISGLSDDMWMRESQNPMFEWWMFDELKCVGLFMVVVDVNWCKENLCLCDEYLYTHVIEIDVILKLLYFPL